MASPEVQEQKDLQEDHSGYLDQVASILKGHQHPIIIIEEAAFRWMGLRVCSDSDLDLLIRDGQLDAIVQELLASGQYQRTEQKLACRMDDAYVKQVPRLQGIGESHPFHDICLSLWSEAVAFLSVDGPKVEVPDPVAWNANLMESRYDPVADDVVSISFQSVLAQGTRILPKSQAQSPDCRLPVFVPTVPAMIDSLVDRYRYCHSQPESCSLAHRIGALPSYHLTNFIRYLHLEKPHQRGKLLSELAERSQDEMKARLDRYKRKPMLNVRDFLRSKGQ